MIESNISNLAATAMRQDVRSVQGQREASKTTVADQASSIPMASSGVEAADSATTAVASQPAGVVTRLGETTEQVPLYEANRPTAGNIIRPSIEIAENARPTSTETDRQLNEQVALERTALNELEERPTVTTRGNDPSINDVEKLV